MIVWALIIRWRRKHASIHGYYYCQNGANERDTRFGLNVRARANQFDFVIDLFVEFVDGLFIIADKSRGD